MQIQRTPLASPTPLSPIIRYVAQCLVMKSVPHIVLATETESQTSLSNHERLCRIFRLVTIL